MYYMDESNSGGVAAKKGFFYQDYMATLLSTKMLLDSNIIGIGNEVGDDIEIYAMNNVVTYVQVKTGTVDNHWTITELKKPRGKISGGLPKPHSSILHKSFDFDNDPKVTSQFMLVTDNDTSSSLNFLKIPFQKRDGKTERIKIVESICKALGKNYRSGNNNNGEYWVDNTTWEVFENIEHIVLNVEHNLRVVCEEMFGSLMSCIEITQLGELLCNKIYKKSQLSKKTSTLEDKTLTRTEAKNLIENYVRSTPSYRKAYPKSNLNSIVNQSFESINLQEKRKGFTQDFNFDVYRNDYIVDMLAEWMDEVLLKPSELAGVLSSSKIHSILKSRIKDNELGKLISKIILNSILRKQHKTQPIPVMLFAANSSKCLKFDSVSIITNEGSPDDIWISINEFISNGDNIDCIIDTVCEKMKELVMIDMDNDRKIILESKDDNFLFKHSTNEILNNSNGFSKHLNRFKFIIFISYKYENYDSSTLTHELQKEMNIKINKISNELKNKSPLFNKIRLGIYVFPTPCNDTIIEKFKTRVST